jgi:hypothetical protein
MSFHRKIDFSAAMRDLRRNRSPALKVGTLEWKAEQIAKALARAGKQGGRSNG